jgi:hypothetical protein
MSDDNVYSAWRELEVRFLDAIDAGEIQRREMKRAFYAGAAAMFALMLAASEHPVEEVCLMNVSVLKEEIDAFAREVAEGRA